VWEDPVAFRLDVDPSGMLVGTVPLPAPARPDDVVVLRLRYRVVREGTATGAGPVRVPMLAVPWPPAEALPGTFSARVDLPAGTRLEEGFPASWAGEAAAPDDLARYRAELPVLPAFVSFRAGGIGAAEGRPGPGGPSAGEAPASVPHLVRRAGFVFWGLFVVFGATVALYLVWMFRAERRERGRPPSGTAAGTSP
jgi:hypothetical protein